MNETFADDLERIPSLLGQRPLTSSERAGILRKQAEALIRHLYDPHPEYGWRASGRTVQFRGEAINWGDLHVVDVVPGKDGSFIVCVEEAAPDCPLFIAPLET